MPSTSRVVLTLIVASQFLAGLVPASHEDDDCGSGRDAGSKVETAVDATAPGSCAGSGSLNDRDFYRVEIGSAGLVLNAAVVGSPSASLEIFDAARTRGTFSGFGAPGVAYHVAPGTWYVAVYMHSSTHGTYTLTLSLSSDAASPDCDLSGDARDAVSYGPWPTAGTATLVPAGTCSGTLDVGDPSDLVAFTTDGTQTARVTLTHPSGSPTMSGYAISSDGMIDRDLGGDATTRTARFADTGVTRTWLVRIEGPGAQRTLASMPWTLTVALEPLPAGNDCGTGRDLPAPSPGGAYAPVASGTSCAAGREAADTGDAYAAVPPTGPAMARLTYNGPTGTRAFVESPYEREIAEPGSPANLYLSGHETSLSVIAYRHDTGVAAPYSFTYELLPDLQNDCLAGHDAPVRREWAVELSLDAVCSGSYDGGDESDWYRVLTEPGDMLEISADSRVRAGFFGNEYYEEWDGGGSTDGRTVISSSRSFGYAERVAGPVAFGLHRLLATDYDLQVTIAPRAVQNDCASGHDADSTFGEPVVVEQPGITCAGEFTTRADSHDDYVADLLVGDIVLVSVTPAQGGFTPALTIFDPDGDFRDDVPPVTSQGTTTHVLPVDEEGRWMFWLQAGMAPSAYSITFAILRLP